MRYLNKFAFSLFFAISLIFYAPASATEMVEQAVIVHFKYGSTDLTPLFNLERRLENAILKARAGEYDGNEVAIDGSEGYLYMYGPDADRLYEVVAPILTVEPFMEGAKVKKRYGPPQDGVREVTITIAP